MWSRHIPKAIKNFSKAFATSLVSKGGNSCRLGFITFEALAITIHNYEMVVGCSVQVLRKGSKFDIIVSTKFTHKRVVFRIHYVWVFDQNPYLVGIIRQKLLGFLNQIWGSVNAGVQVSRKDIYALICVPKHFFCQNSGMVQ